MYRSNSPDKNKWLIKTKECENSRKNRDKVKSSFQKEEKIGKMHEGYRRERIFTRNKNRDERKQR